MRFFLLLAFLLCAADCVIRRGKEPNGKLFALLVAGSNGWFNYRHQADVAHSYHVLLDHGVEADNIIVMIYDDIANNKQNPFPGKLINNPGGKDFYEGLKIDYTGKSVNPSNFLNIIKGNASGIVGGNGRVLESGPEDRVFVYFTDHGAVGLISFPDGILTTKELNDALKYAYQKKRFNDLVFYLEACESGSMFEKVLSSKINVYAITAANGQESSWGTYCENPQHLPCLGDLFSVNWMEDSDAEDLTSETLGDQFGIVQKKTDKSHVCKFGLFDLQKDPVGWFQGMQKSRHRLSADRRGDWERTSVPSRDVELYYLKKQIASASNEEDTRIYQQREQEILEERHWIKRVFKKLVTVMYEEEDETRSEMIVRRTLFFEHNSGVVKHPECHNNVIHEFNKHCINLNQYDYALKYVYVLNNLCDEEDGNYRKVNSFVRLSCSESDK